MEISNNNDYIIEFPFDYKNLQKKVRYYVEYKLIIECKLEVWIKIHDNLINDI